MRYQELQVFQDHGREENHAGTEIHLWEDMNFRYFHWNNSSMHFYSKAL